MSNTGFYFFGLKDSMKDMHSFSFLHTQNKTISTYAQYKHVIRNKTGIIGMVFQCHSYLYV